jgi:transmembrane sensor
LDHQQYIHQLLDKFNRQACTPEELQELHNWLDEKAAAGEQWSFTSDEEKAQLKLTMQQAVFSTITANTPVKTIGKYRWMRYAAAAAAILLLTGSVWYLNARPSRMVIASMPGKMEKITLPDGSTVWLNDNTEIAYYSNFTGNRTIELTKGEAFFEVKKDATHPFTVQSNDVQTTVKGTSFSVKMIDRTGDIKVSVVTGKVLVHNQQDTLGLLVPRQRLRFIHRSHAAAIDSVQAGEANAWMQGELFLQNASLNEVIQWLQDHFNVKVNNKRLNYTGEYYLQVKRDISLQEIIKILNLLGSKDKVQFILYNQTVIIQ